MNRLIVSLCFCLLANVLAAWNNLSLDKLSDEHPRYLTDKSSLKDVQRMIEKEAWASDKADEICQSENMKAKAAYAIWSRKGDNTLMLFMGNGTKLETPSLSLVCDSPADVLLENKEGNWWYTSSQTCTLVMNEKKMKLLPTEKPLKFGGM